MERKFRIKEIFYTLQGEGFHSGRPAVFCRFSGCNLWSGLEKDRPKAICNFCDTDFVGLDGQNGGEYSAVELVKKILSLWPSSKTNCFVVFTGGEPGLQLTNNLLNECVKFKIETAVESNGTIILPKALDWVCISPKPGAKLKQDFGNELKLVYDCGLNPKHYEKLNFKHFYLQPMDKNDGGSSMLGPSLEFCKNNPKWKLSLQTHKILNIP